MLEHLTQPLSLEYILDSACSTPEDFQEYNMYLERNSVEQVKEDFVLRPYTGFMRYSIDTHCKRFVIIARRRKNGTYEIKDFIETEI